LLVLGDAGLCLMRLGERGFHTILKTGMWAGETVSGGERLPRMTALVVGLGRPSR
jgi:hypothetical protein